MRSTSRGHRHERQHPNHRRSHRNRPASSIISGHIQPSGLPAKAGFTDTFLLLAAFSAVAVLLALAIPGARRSRYAAPDPLLEELVS